MRVRRGFNPRIDKMSKGSKVIKLSEGSLIRAIVFRVACGEGEALITNVEEKELESGVFPERYYKRWPIATKYKEVKQKFELENFSGRLVENIKQDFYAMMRVSNMPTTWLREANRKVAKAVGNREVPRKDYLRKPHFHHNHKSNC